MPTPPTPTCSKCDYELTGLGIDDACPECGTAIWSPPVKLPVSGFAVTSLVMGLLSIGSLVAWAVTRGLVGFGSGPMTAFAVTGVISGHIATAQVRRGTRGGGSAGFAIAGLVLCWIGMVPVVLGLVITAMVLLGIPIPTT